jgi:hypothetical protein
MPATESAQSYSLMINEEIIYEDYCVVDVILYREWRLLGFYAMWLL